MIQNKKWLLTTTDWFIAPDGESYRAVHGTVHAVLDSEKTLGVRTNAKSTNWYISIGNMIIAGCQVMYAIQCNEVSYSLPKAEIDFDGKRVTSLAGNTRIYNADVVG